MSRFQKRRAFTIVELLFVIGILCVLIALVLPAMRRGVPEAARRTQCMNNLRQIALASLNYESAHMEFPASTGIKQFRGIGSADQANGFVAILPFIEQNNLFIQITNPSTIDRVNYPAFPPLYGAPAPHWETQLPVFNAPAFRHRKASKLPFTTAIALVIVPEVLRIQNHFAVALTDQSKLESAK